MKLNLDLFVRIAIVGFLASVLNAYILAQISSNYGFLSMFVIIIAILCLISGSVIFLLIRKIDISFVNNKNINIFCIILAVAIILPAIIKYYTIVPPAEISNDWICDRGQELCNKFDAMKLIYDDVEAFTIGEFVKDGRGIGYFNWEYDRISKEITLYERLEIRRNKPDGWKLKLRLEITGDKGRHKMKTYYVSSSGKFDLATITSISNATGNYDIVKRYPPFNNEQFNGITWTESSEIIVARSGDVIIN